MKTNEEWKAKEEELERLIEQRKEISKKIHILKIDLRQHKNYVPKGDRTDTEAYKMFGKPLKYFNDEEKRIYYTARQRINRAKRKENNKNKEG